jgi:hypothetical protein
MEPIRYRKWTIPERLISSRSKNPDPELFSHAAACLPNVSEDEAHIKSRIVFSNGGQVVSDRLTKPALTRHIRFKETKDPETIFHQTQYASIIDYQVPTVAHQPRFGSRQAKSAFPNTVAYLTGTQWQTKSRKSPDE